MDCLLGAVDHMAELVGEQKLCILNQMSFTCAANELPKYSPSFIFMQAKLLYIFVAGNYYRSVIFERKVLSYLFWFYYQQADSQSYLKSDFFQNLPEETGETLLKNT